MKKYACESQASADQSIILFIGDAVPVPEPGVRLRVQNQDAAGLPLWGQSPRRLQVLQQGRYQLKMGVGERGRLLPFRK